ncbi:MAG: hypothetical protein IPL20_06715 [Saprospiraceae bacterium]|nr:hypothetical protein [Saprospiraceae bacterium]
MEISSLIVDLISFPCGRLHQRARFVLQHKTQTLDFTTHGKSRCFLQCVFFSEKCIVIKSLSNATIQQTFCSSSLTSDKLSRTFTPLEIFFLQGIYFDMVLDFLTAINPIRVDGRKKKRKMN